MAYSYIFFISWTDAFRLGRWFTLHVIILILLFLLSVMNLPFKKKIPTSVYSIEDHFLFLGILTYLIAGIINPCIKTINYALSYMFVFGVGYFALKGMLVQYTKYQTVLNINTIGVIFVVVFVLIEFSFQMLFDFDIQNFILRTREHTATYNIIFPRSYGFATEPTILALYLNVLGPIAMSNLFNKKGIHWFLKLIIFVGCILAWLTTFSAAGVGSLTLSASMVLIIMFFSGNITKTIRSRPFITICIFIGIILFMGVCFNQFEGLPIQAQQVFRPLLSKATLKKDNSSVIDRVSRWKEGSNAGMQSPFWGQGIGSTSSRGLQSNTNLYIYLWRETGLMGLLPVIIFLLLTFFHIINSKVKEKYIFLIGFIAGVIHFNAISTIQHPFLWVLIILFSFSEIDHKRRSKWPEMCQ